MTKTDTTRRIPRKFMHRMAVALVAAIFFSTATSRAVADDAVPEAAKNQAEEIFSTRCSVCHGMSGKGDGPGSAALNPKPRNFTDAEWQKAVNDEHIEKIIQYGGIAVGKSAMMPGNPDLISKPQVVKAIRAKVRELGQKH